MFIFANVMFVAFGSGELQSWDAYGIDKSKQESVESRRRKMSKKLSVAMANFWNKKFYESVFLIYLIVFFNEFPSEKEKCEVTREILGIITYNN